MVERISARRAHTGAASVEYAIVTGFAVIVLFVPIDGHGRSALELLLDALRGFHQNGTFLLSLP